MGNSLLNCIWFLICLGLAQAKVHLIAQDQAPTQAPTQVQVNSQAPTQAPVPAQALGPKKATKRVSDPGSTQARAFFVFGDSLVDSGNNNFLPTPARADMPPYGIDYPSHQPTGRFSNGYNIPDLISLSIGSEPTMPYLHPALNGDRLLVGANFASAGIGILNDTGIQFVAIMKIWQQFELFEQYKIRVTEQMGAEKANKLVKESLVLISLGGNDFVNNYYLLPITVRNRQLALPAYISLLIAEYRKILKKLYGLGPRRIIVTGTGPLGCAPAELAMWSRYGECATNLQNAAYLFNPQLTQMIKEINKEIGSDVFVTANAHDKNMDFITNPGSYGFKTSKEACCGQGPFNGLGLCTPLSKLCDDRNKYVFWDPFHPTEKANRIIADMILRGSKEMMHPFNLTTIMQLDSRI